MTELQRKSCRTLELPKVLELLARQAVSPKAKEMALALEPEQDVIACQRLQRQTEDAVKLAGLFGSPSFSGVRDVSPALDRAAAGGCLNQKELLDIAALLRSARSAKGYLEKDSQVETSLEDYFHRLTGNKYLEEKIEQAILSEEEMADNASPALRDIRRNIRVSSSRIREALNRVITSAGSAKALQDAVITVRDGRYVVPVKAEFKGSVPGLVHDVSSSGATVFVEPMQAVELNNAIRELQAKEKNEIERILMEFSGEAAAFAPAIRQDYEILCTLDFIFAKAKLAYEMKALRPGLTGPETATKLKRARHPLLPQDTAVPIDFTIGGKTDAVIITGPNTGGKTVSLKTLGLLTLMAQCGLQIPCGEDSVIQVCRSVLADIGDEQSIEQSLSTFSSHMKTIVEILSEAGPGSLTLMDELGAGTDPVEGAALATAIIERLREQGALVASTTHYAELKTYALQTEGVENASCEFDVATLKPTYKLIFGIPGKSNAFAISQRLGLDADIIEKAKAGIDSQSLAFEDVIRALEEKRQQMESQLQQARRDREKAEEEKRRAEQAYQAVEQDRKSLIEQARDQAQEIIQQARRAAEESMEELRRLRREQQKNPAESNLSEARAVMMGRLSEAERKAIQKKIKRQAAPLPRALQEGDVVELVSNGMRCTVARTPQPGGAVQLTAGIMKLTAKPEELQLISAAPPKKQQPKGAVKTQAPSRPERGGSEVDLRGMTVEEAILEMERFLDLAWRLKMPSVTVIHGKGTGALRQAVHARLKGAPHVQSFRLGAYGEGETGVTIVALSL